MEGRVGEAGAVYAFAGWLTSRRKPVTLSATHNAAEAAELAEEYCKSQGWEVSEDWHTHLKPGPAEGTA